MAATVPAVEITVPAVEITVPAVEIESDAPPPVVEDADAEARARDRYRRAVRAFFNELCDEPLAGGAAAEALAEFAGEDDSQLWDRGATADDRLLQIARATAHRHGLGPSDQPDAE